MVIYVPIEIFYRFEKSKVGETQVGKMLPTLCAAAGVERFTNKSIRPSSIRAMKRSGMGDRQITDVTLHKKIQTLENYDVGQTAADRRNACAALGSVGAKTMGPQNAVSLNNANLLANRALLYKLPENFQSSSTIVREVCLDIY